MKNTLIILISYFALIIQVFGQEKKAETNMVMVKKDSLFIPKQTNINNVKSRKVVQFDLPANTIKWGYYFRSVEKHKIDEALLKDYFKNSDFITDSLTQKSDSNKKYYTIKAREGGPVKLETLLLDKAGADDFLQAENNICLVQRPDGFFWNESSLCEVGDCHASNKVIADSQLSGEYYLGFRNINFRENAYIIVQIVAFVK